MQSVRFLRFLCCLCMLPLLGAGCSGSSGDKTEAAAILASKESILRYIPADTPYVYAGLQAMPDDVVEKLEPHLKAVVQSYSKLLQAAMNQRPEEGEAGLDEESRKRISAVIGDVAAMVTAEGMPEAGIGRESAGAVYGVGLLPVIRLTLIDQVKFESTLARLEEKAGAKMTVAEIDGYTYRFAGNEEARAIVAVIDDQLVVTVIPANLDESLLMSVLGLSLPEKSIADSGALATLARDYGFKPFALGMVDIERIAAAFLDPEPGVNAELLNLMDYGSSGLSEVCKSEIRSLAGVAPRLVSGYTDVTVEHFKSTTVIELRSDLARGLQKLTAAVPGLGNMQGGLISFGMSLDLMAARDFYSARLDAMEADPYECELLADLQEGAVKGRMLLNQPIPPIAYSLRGFLAVVDDIKGMDLRSQQPPTAVDMRFLVSTDNPSALIATGAMFSPEVAALDLKADSKPVKLDVPALTSTAKAAWVAMSNDAIALSFGDGSESGLEAMLGASSRQPPLFMSTDMDAGRYYGFIGDAMALGDNGQKTPEIAEATGEVMKSFEKIFRRIAFDIDFTGRGVEMLSTVELAE